MHPAYSVIIFTTASGAGYGLLVLLALAGVGGFLAPDRGLGLWGFGIALALDRPLLCVDLPGHGDSALPDSFTFAAAGAALAQVLAAQPAGGSVVVGHQFGGRVALAALAVHPELTRGLVLIDVPVALPVKLADEQKQAFLASLASSYEGVSRMMFSSLGRDTAQSRAIYDAFSRTKPATVQSFVREGFYNDGNRDALASKAPTLMLATSRLWKPGMTSGAVLQQLGWADTSAAVRRLGDSGYWAMKDQPDSLAAIIATEPAIAVSTLRLANSVAYGGLKQVIELDEAVGRVGMRQVASLATTIATRGALVSKNPVRAQRLTELWSTSLTAAITTRRLAAGQTNPEEAYLAGLLHDIGKPLVLKLLDQCEKNLLEPLTPATLEELLEGLHVELGHKLLQLWRIPEPVCEVTLRHHHPKPSSSEILLARVQAGDAVANYLALSDGERRAQPIMEHQAIERLNFTELELADLLIEIEDQVAVLRQFV